MTTSTTITRVNVFKFWAKDIVANNADYIDCGEFNTTVMGETAADHFGVMTELGDSAIEQEIFDWAVDFAACSNANDFVWQIYLKSGKIV